MRLSDKIEVSRVIVGKYGRNDTSPSIDIAKKIADAFNVSLNFLVGDSKNSHFDKRTLKMLEELNEETKNKLFFLVNAIIRDQKTQQAYS